MSAVPSTSSDSFCAVPNRVYFEREIWRINNCLSKVQNEMKQFWSDKRKAEMNKIKSELADFRAQFYACQENDEKLSKCLKILQNQHQQKMREMHELEDNDLVYKDLTLARQKLVQVEELYNKRNFSSMREEQLQVNELNRIRRNVQKLAKYVLLVDQRKLLELSIKEDRQKIREQRQRMRLFRDKIHDCRKQIKDTHQTFLKMKEFVNDLKTEKTNLIEKYDDERQAYDGWLKSNKANVSSSTPSTNTLLETAMEPLQLFYVQKTNCKRLIDYIQRLMVSANTSESIGNGTAITIPEQSESYDVVKTNDSANDGNSGADSDLADEFPAAFKHFATIRDTNVESIQSTCNNNDSSSSLHGQHNSSTANNSKINKRVFKQLKKATKRQGMPLSHDIDYIKLFNDIDVLPPKTIADAETTLAEVQTVLRFYEEQTALTSHDDLFVQWEDGADYSPIPSATGSTFTSPRSLSSCSLALKADDES